MNRIEQKKVLEAFRKVMVQELHNLQERPDLLWQQMYNRLQWTGENLERHLEHERVNRYRPGTRPWLRTITPFRESEALVSTLVGHAHGVNACEVSSDGTFIVSTEETDEYDHKKNATYLKLWDLTAGRERATLAGHSSHIETFKISPDSSYIVSGSRDETLKIWNAATGRERASLIGHNGGINDCAVSPDSSFIVSASDDSTLKIWNAVSGLEELTLKGHLKPVVLSAVSPDGTFVVSASEDNTLKIWDIATGRELASMSGHEAYFCKLIISPDSTFIVSAGRGDSLKVWDVATGQERTTIIPNAERVWDCALSPDGSFLASAIDDSTLKIYDVASGNERHTLDTYDFMPTAIKFSPDGTFIVSASIMNTLKAWDTATGQERFILHGHGHGVRACELTPDCKFLVSGSMDKTLKIWDLTSLQKHTKEGGHVMPVSDCIFNPDGKSVVTASMDATLKIWDVSSGAEKYTLDDHSGGVTACAVSPDGAYIVSASEDKTLKIWDSFTGQVKTILYGHNKQVLNCTFNPQGTLIISADADNVFKIWDPHTGQEKANAAVLKFKKNRSYDPYKPKASAICTVSPDGTSLIALGDDRTLKAWDLTSGRESFTMAGFESSVLDCAVSTDGEFIVSADLGGVLKIWDMHTGQMRASLTGHTELTQTCVISPDCSFIVSASYDKTLKIWDVTTGKEKFTLKGHTDWVKACAVSNDGSRIVSASEDKSLKVWDAATGKEIASIPLLGVAICIRFQPDRPLIVCGEQSGNVYFLELINPGFNSRAKREIDINKDIDIKTRERVASETEMPENNKYPDNTSTSFEDQGMGSPKNIISRLRNFALEEERYFFNFLEQKLSEGTLDDVKPEDISRRIMGTSERPTAINELFKILGTKEEKTRQEAARILFPEEAGFLLNRPTEKYDSLADCLKMGITSGSVMTISACIWTSLRLRKADAFDICSLVFLNSDINIRLMFAGLFGYLKDKRTTSGLIVALRYEQIPEVRSAMILALGNLDDTWAIEVLTDCLHDENTGVAINAAKALGQIGGPEVMRTLESVAKNENIGNEVRYWATVGMLQAAFKTENKNAGGAKQPGSPAEKPGKITCKCGYINSSTNKYCKKCGRELK
ncbi:MAG: HEAT repeat domain-containing protein [Bacteroidales bacterium]|nr:HEAT repeat domain-containing protein [Bacteroidales bacterium]